ncbi:MAG: M23 family metallopeptidase [Betaproteobacteria bacterium]
MTRNVGGRTVWPRLAPALALTFALASSGCARQQDPPPPGRTPAAARDVDLPSELRVVAARLAPGATLASLLRANNVAAGTVAEIVSRVSSVFDLRRMRAAQPYRLEQTEDGELERFDYEVDGDSILRVSRSSDDDPPFVATMVPIEKTRSVEVVRGTIDQDTSSLFAAMDAAGETVDLSIALADVFGGDIDFSTDVQPGDTFEVVVEKQYRRCDELTPECDDGGRRGRRLLAGYGPILAAEFDNDGRAYRAIRFAPEHGPAAYYDEHGRSLRRFFLRSPLKFTPVVTSGFSRHRFHPILRIYRPHLGIDYRAPIGAPVIAVAGGVVVQAGRFGGAGRLVHLRHNNGFESEYLHLSRILVHVGERVDQGDVIGRVGMSGLATGPHLDFRLKKNGAFVNPLTVQRQLPPGEPIPPGEMATFVGLRDRFVAQLAPSVQNAAAVADHRP